MLGHGRIHRSTAKVGLARHPRFILLHQQLEKQWPRAYDASRMLQRPQLAGGRSRRSGTETRRDILAEYIRCLNVRFSGRNT